MGGSLEQPFLYCIIIHYSPRVKYNVAVLECIAEMTPRVGVCMLLAINGYRWVLRGSVDCTMKKKKRNYLPCLLFFV